MKRFTHLILIVTCLLMVAACNKVDNRVVPNYMVRIDLGTYALWTTYGVEGVGEYNIFNREKRLPSNFAYTANTYTGYGGVLLIKGLDIATSTYEPLAYDLSCPVENRADVMLSIDPANFEAVCSKCQSHYNVLTGAGGPVSGTALSQHVGLRAYKVRASVNGGYLITSY
ncbi:MAG: hypothetical protein II592_01555 [Muribaculaceae bacterium]|jgi:hypothetical protein|nr:hypothetical protein [Muribaculaceae bacterium]MBQ4138214.1 hypothetical protein [Muribaculaceae bacterium]